MSGLLYAVHWFVYYAIEFSLKGTLRTILDYTYHAFFVLLPVTGWVAESWLGRYRAIVIGLIMSTLAVLLIQVAFMALQQFLIPAFLLIISALIIGTIGTGSLYTIMLPFTLDQMIGASAEELSAVVKCGTGGALILE